MKYYRRHIYFDNRNDEVTGFSLLLNNDFCIHSDIHIQRLYGFNDFHPMIYQVDSKAVEFLINSGVRLNLLN